MVILGGEKFFLLSSLYLSSDNIVVIISMGIYSYIYKTPPDFAAAADTGIVRSWGLSLRRPAGLVLLGEDIDLIVKYHL